MRYPTPSAPSVFTTALVLGSVIPYVFGQSSALQDSISPNQLFGLFVGFLIFVNFIHVPATLYLFTDSEISARARRHPVTYIILPILIVVASPALTFTLFEQNTSLADHCLFLFFFFFLSWQNLHIGKQSYGVLSFVSIASQRRPRTKQQMQFERRVISMAAFFSLCPIFGGLLAVAAREEMQLDYETLGQLSSVLYWVGAIGCATAATLAIVYLVQARSTFTFSGAVIFLVGSTFFLPSYIFDLLSPATTTKTLEGSGFLNIALFSFAIVHGMQYVIFLFFHAYTQGKNRTPKNKAIQHFTLWPVIYLLSLAVFGYYLRNGFLVKEGMDLITSIVNVMYSPSTLFAVLTGFGAGLSMAHFWLDQHLWKLSQPEQREWIRSRYGNFLPSST